VLFILQSVVEKCCFTAELCPGTKQAVSSVSLQVFLASSGSKFKTVDACYLQTSRNGLLS